MLRALVTLDGARRCIPWRRADDGPGRRFTEGIGVGRAGEDLLVTRDGVPLLRARDACTFWRRLRGLHALPPLGADDALIIRPCDAVQTFGMRHAIDVLWLDGDGRVLDVETLPPGRVSRRAGARVVVEAASGTARRLGLERGQVLGATAPDEGGDAPGASARRAPAHGHDRPERRSAHGSATRRETPRTVPRARPERLAGFTDTAAHTDPGVSRAVRLHLPRSSEDTDIDIALSPRRLTITRLGAPLLWACEARSLRARLRGLRGMAPLGANDALIIRPCRMLQTFSVSAPIDVAFIDVRGRVLSVATVPPRRVRLRADARTAVVMAEGTAKRVGLAVGHVLRSSGGAWS